MMAENASARLKMVKDRDSGAREYWHRDSYVRGLRQHLERHRAPGQFLYPWLSCLSFR